MAAALFALTACRTVPVTGRTQLILTSEATENEAGLTAFNEYKSKYTVATTGIYSTTLNRVGTRLKNVADEDSFAWEFVVLNDATQNAFCLPGGKVAVYSGLMDFMRNEAELAVVVSHEVAHAIARHGGERSSWGVVMEVVGEMVSASTDNNEYINGIYGVGANLGVMLPFSRKDEYEADRIGLILMAKAGYDPNTAIEFWTRFSNGKEVSWTEKITSTHPCDTDRIANLKTYLPEALGYYNNAKNRYGKGTNLR